MSYPQQERATVNVDNVHCLFVIFFPTVGGFSTHSARKEFTNVTMYESGNEF